jgi:DNA repair protein RadC
VPSSRPRRLRERPPEARATYTVKSLPVDERPRERLLARGPDALSEGELLAIILRTGLPGENVVELANDLLDQYLGFWGLARASVTQLQERRGLKGAKVAQLKAAIEIGRRMSETTPEDHRAQVSSPVDAARLLRFAMAGLEQEELWVILLTTRGHAIGRPRAICRGALNSANVRSADVFRDAVRENAASIVLAHNHPSGDSTPSAQDAQVTRQLVAAGRQLDIEVLDHLVIGRPDFVSMKNRGLGF